MPESVAAALDTRDQLAAAQGVLMICNRLSQGQAALFIDTIAEVAKAGREQVVAMIIEGVEQDAHRQLAG